MKKNCLPPVVEIKNSPCPVEVLTTEVEGTLESNPPVIGKYRNVLAVYKESNARVFYTSDGIPSVLAADFAGSDNFNDLKNRPKYDGEEMTSATNIPDWADKIGEQADALAQETQDRIAADNVLQTAISEEASARETADTVLGGRIDATLAALDTEVATRQAADTALQNQIEDVASDLADETSARQTAISDEADVRQAADTNLQSQIDAISASSDVTDVVGTKAALDSYDTSVLRPNDIIKVLQDESLSGETTYYRWTGSAFTLIGEEGPYYTKAQADTLLNNKVDKVAGKQLSTEDFTTAEKAKLDELADIKSIGSNLTLDANGELSGTASGLDPATSFWGQTAQNGVVSGNIQLAEGDNVSFAPNPGGIVSDTPRITANSSYLGIYGGSSSYLGYLLIPRLVGGQFDFINGDVSIHRHRILNLAAPTDSTDAVNKQYVDDLAISYATLNGAGAPTTATEGEYVGQLYLDAENGEMYYLSAIDDSVTPNTYTWAQMGGDGIPTDATFWGASYDATTNSVSGPVYSSMSSVTRPTYPAPGFYAYSDSRNPVVVGLGGTTSVTGADRGRIQFYSQGDLGKRWCLLVDADIVFSAGESAIDVCSKRILNVSDPNAAQDAATKNYVDTAVASAGATVLANTDYQTLWQ